MILIDYQKQHHALDIILQQNHQVERSYHVITKVFIFSILTHQNIAQCWQHVNINLTLEQNENFVSADFTQVLADSEVIETSFYLEI